MAHTLEQRGRDGKPRFWGACRLPDGKRMRYRIFQNQQAALAWAVAEEAATWQAAEESRSSALTPPYR